MIGDLEAGSAQADAATIANLERRIARLEAIIDYSVKSSILVVPHDFTARANAMYEARGDMTYLK